MYIIFLNSVQIHKLWVLFGTASSRQFLRVSTMYVLSRNMKKYQIFYLKNYSFWWWKFQYICIGVFRNEIEKQIFRQIKIILIPDCSLLSNKEYAYPPWLFSSETKNVEVFKNLKWRYHSLLKQLSHPKSPKARNVNINRISQWLIPLLFSPEIHWFHR